MKQTFLWALALLPTLAIAQKPADLVIWNGTIYTADSEQRVVEATFLDGERVYSLDVATDE